MRIIKELMEIWPNKVCDTLYLYYFSFSFGLTTQEGVWESVTSQVSPSHSHMTSHDGSHDKCGKVVHRPCSSCISSIQKIMETPSSSPC